MLNENKRKTQGKNKKSENLHEKMNIGKNEKTGSSVLG